MRTITQKEAKEMDRYHRRGRLNWRIRKLCEGLEDMAKAFSEVGVKAQKELVDALKKIKLSKRLN